MAGESNDPLVIERRTLDLGAELFRQPPPPGSASFSLSYLGPAGWGFEPKGREGLALVASELVVSGAGRHDRAELARALDRLGATLTSDCHPESTEITLWGPEEQFDRLLPLFVEALRAPRFEPREVARVKRQLAERQLRERSQPDRRADKELFRGLFPGGHPYGQTGIGTPASLARISANELRRFHRSHYVASGGQLVATTARSAESMARQLGRALHSWGSGPAPPPPALPAPRAATEELSRIELGGGSQVEIRIGGPAVTRADPAYPGVLLATELLGGRAMLSRLFQELREKRGLVYHASSEVEAMRWGGFWTAEAGTDPGHVDEVLGLLRAEIAAMRQHAPAPEALDRIRESLIGSLWLELETTATAHELALEVAYHGLPGDFYRTWPSVLRDVTPEAVRAAAADHVDERRAVTVAVGPLRGPVRGVSVPPA